MSFTPEGEDVIHCVRPKQVRKEGTTLVLNKNVGWLCVGLGILGVLYGLLVGGGLAAAVTTPVFWLAVALLYLGLLVGGAVSPLGVWLLVGGVLLVIVGFTLYSSALVIGVLLALVGVLYLVGFLGKGGATA